MGTNYYARLDVCEHCGRSEEDIHLGKSSVGWKFGFRGYEKWDLGHIIHSEKDLKMWLEVTTHVITDEYGKDISDEEFWELVERKRTEKLDHAKYPELNDIIDEDTGSVFTLREFS